MTPSPAIIPKGTTMHDRLIGTIKDRKDSDFDGECHLSNEEADEIIATLAAADEQVPVEPYGYAFQHEETGLQQVVDAQQVEWGFEENNPRWVNLGPVYFHPPVASTADGWKPPEACDGFEQAAFETWAKTFGYDMNSHPLHYLFMDKQTNAARKGWSAALAYVRQQFSARPSPPCDGRAEALEEAVEILEDAADILAERNYVNTAQRCLRASIAIRALIPQKDKADE